MKHISIFLIIFLLMATTASANVLINEVAWMGNSGSANAEWIELYNPDSESVNLDGWTLKAIDGSPSITLSGTISSLEYFLLERTSDETVPSIPANQIYSGSLGNNGEHLVLRDKAGVVINEIDHASGWLGGDNTSKQTMQLVAGNWGTGPATPGAQNTVSLPETVTSTTTTGDTSTSSATTTPGDSESGIQEPKKESETEVIFVNPDIRYSAKVISPSFATVGVPVPFSVQVKQGSKKDFVSGRFEWYLGDGDAHRYYKNTSFDHIFYYPGTYTVVMEYYSDAFRDEPDSIHKKVITIVPDAINIEGMSEDGGIVLKNDTSKEIDINQWVMKVGTTSFTFPKYTLIPKKNTLTLSGLITGLVIHEGDKVALYNQSNKLISDFTVPNNK